MPTDPAHQARLVLQAAAALDAWRAQVRAVFSRHKPNTPPADDLRALLESCPGSPTRNRSNTP